MCVRTFMVMITGKDFYCSTSRFSIGHNLDPECVHGNLKLGH